MIFSHKLKGLSEDELSLLVYSFKDILIDSEGNLQECKLKALNIKTIIPRLLAQEPQLTDEGKTVLKSLVNALNIFP